MTEDLAKRLRDVAEATGPNKARQIALDAADRIEELEAKLAKAVEELRTIRDTARAHAFGQDGVFCHICADIANGEADRDAPPRPTTLPGDPPDPRQRLAAVKVAISNQSPATRANLSGRFKVS